MRTIQNKLNFAHGVWVDAIGRLGGLALLWTDEVDLSIRSLDARFIDFEVKCSSGEFWRGTSLYGWAESGQKSKTWDMIRSLGSVPTLPWILTGDFNDVLYESEKQGGNVCDLTSITRFKDAIESCGLKDLGFSGYKFTWSNRRGEAVIEERLDCALANDEWLDLFPSFSVHNVVWDSSNHLPIIIKASRRGLSFSCF